MAKLSYLNLVNRVLKRITQSEISTVTGISGHAQIIGEMLNEAQNEVFKEANWYSLYATRKWKTVTYSATTIAAVNGTPDTFTDSASGFGDFQNGQMILVSGFTGNTDNNGTWTLDASSGAAAGTLTLQTADTLVADDAASETVTITAVTYPVASDFGRAMDLTDITNNRIYYEDYGRVFDADDPDQDYTGTVHSFDFENDFYRLYPIPAGNYTIRERYWKVPTTLSTDAQTSDLPIEVENCLIQYALAQILNYQNKFDHSDRAFAIYNRMLQSAMDKNKKKIDKFLSFKGRRHIEGITGITAPRFPATFPRYS